MSKTLPKQQYPRKFQQFFPYSLEEQVIERTRFTCSDTLDSPTCPLKMNSYGQLIEDSVGFCCECRIFHTNSL
jgi:hypothetical protein